MNAFDFDELDKAVSEALGTAPTPKKPVADKVDAPEASAIAPVREQTDVPTVEKKTTDRMSTPTSSPAARRTAGRFMDVVHPSSDMRTATPTPVRVSRQGVTIAPIDAPASPQAHEDASVDVAEEPEMIAPYEDTMPMAKPTINMPEDTETEDEQTPEQTLLEAPDLLLLPLESPFLDDAQVEKRPLGAFSLEAPAKTTDDEAPAEESAESMPAKEETTEAVETNKLDDASDADADLVSEQTPVNTALNDQLAEELRSDIIAVESSEVAPEVDKPTAAPVVATPAVVPAPESRPRHEASVIAAPVASSSPAVHGDIPRQYREKPQEISQEVASIYDVEGYQQPIKHPAKSKSGWMTVVWIIVLIALGVGGGVAFYVFDPLRLLQ